MILLAQFEFRAHDYFITEQAVNDVYVLIKRSMRQCKLPNMSIPSPSNSLMGMDTTLSVKYNGQPAQYFPYELLLDGQSIQIGKTDNVGISYGLDVRFSNGYCDCRPYWFKDTEVLRKKEPNLNLRCCGKNLPKYQLSVYLPEAISVATESTKDAEDSLIPVN